MRVASVTGVPTALASLIDECLYKAPEACPTPNNVLARLQKVSLPGSPAASRLQAANQAIVAAQALIEAEKSVASTEAERRQALFATADRGLKLISAKMRQAIVDNAPAAEPDPAAIADEWALKLGPASIGMDPAKPASPGNFGRWQPAFDVIAYAAIGVNIPPDRYEYHGRNHSLWFCDAQVKGVYRWFEMGFMVSVLIGKRLTHVPAGMEPSENAGKAFANALTEWSLARPVMPIDQGEEEAFIDRWLDLFGQAAAGNLRMPNALPEGGDNRGSYRPS